MPGAGALRHLIDVMADLAPNGALDDVLAYLKRTGLAAVQPRLLPQVVGEAKSRKDRRDAGRRPAVHYRKLRWSEINAEKQATSVVAGFLFLRIGEPEADAMEAVLSLDPGVNSRPDKYLAHARLHSAFVVLARNFAKLEGLISDLD